MSNIEVAQFICGNCLKKKNTDRNECTDKELENIICTDNIDCKFKEIAEWIDKNYILRKH